MLCATSDGLSYFLHPTALLWPREPWCRHWASCHRPDHIVCLCSAAYACIGWANKLHLPADTATVTGRTASAFAPGLLIHCSTDNIAECAYLLRYGMSSQRHTAACISACSTAHPEGGWRTNRAVCLAQLVVAACRAPMAPAHSAGRLMSSVATADR